MPRMIRCPGCQRSFKIKDGSHLEHLNCPKCNASLAGAESSEVAPDLLAPLTGQEAAPMPSFSPREPSSPMGRSPSAVAAPKKSNRTTWIVVSVIGGLLACFSCCCGGPVALFWFSGLGGISTAKYETLLEGRAGHETNLVRFDREGMEAERPPAGVFELESFATDLGPMDAYVSSSPNDGQRHPAIIWKFGGFSNSIDGTAWTPGPPDNDQSATVFREAGIVMMYPSLRGGNQNPGYVEGLYGEVDDLLAAYDHLAAKDYVDPNRIYLGGHSTGGTLVLLTAAAASDRFRAVFSFGPVGDPSGYGPSSVPFSIFDRKEADLRSPIKWLHAIHCPTFVFEGELGNVDALQEIDAKSRQANIHCYEVRNTDHFGILGPVNRLLAAKILADTGNECQIEISPSELQSLFY